MSWRMRVEGSSCTSRVYSRCASTSSASERVRSLSLSKGRERADVGFDHRPPSGDDRMTTPMAAKTSSPQPVATPATPSVTPPAPRFAGLDGLRAIAVLTVLAYHLTPGALPGGFLGVDIFFVISGFLITSLLLSEHAGSGRIRLGHFWRRRARRLLPALGVLLLVCCTAAWVIGSDLLVGLGQQVLGATTFSSNWLSIAAGR